MTIRIPRSLALLAAAFAVLALVAACTDKDDSKSVEETQRDTVETENRAISTGFGRLVVSQQVPAFDYSQERQTLIDVETLRAHGTHGTAAVYDLQGDLLWWCPTQGAPVPSTYMLSPSQQYVDIKGDDDHSKFPVDQGEPTGVYIGDSQATWVLCLDDNGTPFGKYAEANVDWTAGVVLDLPEGSRARVDEITFEFTEAQDSAE